MSRREQQTGQPQFRRLGEQQRSVVHFSIDGRAAEGLRGDTVLTALLLNGSKLRNSEFGDGPRAGFCNMGACQDCWIAFEDGKRRRACSTFLEDGMRVITG
jgi:D-hydroxyproline dehydrogenase subunit gamma